MQGGLQAVLTCSLCPAPTCRAVGPMSSSPLPSSSATSSAVSARARPQRGRGLGGQVLRGYQGSRAGPRLAAGSPISHCQDGGGNTAQEVEDRGATASASGQASEPWLG